MTLTVRPCTRQDESAWDAFVDSSPGATFFHRFGWQRVLQEAFGHTSCYLVAEEEQSGQAPRIVGLLPLAQVRSRLFGNTLTSLPFCVYGGIVAETNAAAQGLRDAACALARQTNPASACQSPSPPKY
jgi:CelD/BcsL family acetyltransferase involved in cellulose biosynthesis